MDQFQSPIIHFPHIKKIVREILNEIGTFLEVIELITILSINIKPKSIINIGEKL